MNGTVSIQDLTPRERSVAALTAEKWTPKRIAGALEVSCARVYQLLISIERKVGPWPEQNRNHCIAEWWLDQTDDSCKMHDS